MKKNILIIILVVFISCQKQNNDPVVTGTVQQPGLECLPGAWLVYVSDATKYAFLCKDSATYSSFNCTNSVYITHLPAAFQQLGKRVKFSKWKEVPSCSSSSFAPHYIEVYDLTAE